MPRKNIYNLLDQYLFERKELDLESELEQLILEASIENNYSFSDGLVGLGWLISFLTKYALLEADADEVLYDFDDNIYKMTIKTIASKEIHIEELLSQLLYFQQRLQNNMTQFNSNRKILLFESQKLLIEKIGVFLKSTAIETQLEEKSAIMLRFSYLTATTLNEKEIEEMFYGTMEELVLYFERNIIFEQGEKRALLNTLFAAMQYKNPYWIASLENILKHTDLSSEDFKFLLHLRANFSEDGFLLSKLPRSTYAQNIPYLFFCVSNFKISI